MAVAVSIAVAVITLNQSEQGVFTSITRTLAVVVPIAVVVSTQQISRARRGKYSRWGANDGDRVALMRFDGWVEDYRWVIPFHAPFYDHPMIFSSISAANPESCGAHLQRSHY